MDINVLGFNLAKDIATELITISTALLALSVTFAKDSFSNLSTTKEVCLKIAWVLLLVSILFGILSLMLMAGNLFSCEITPVDQRVQIAAGVQIVLFFVGLLCLGWLYLSGSKFRTP